jgi:iron complex outermembrane receptor protein
MNHPTGLKPSRLSAALFAALVLPMSASALAQDAGDDEQATTTATSSQATEIEAVTVVGSRIKRTEIEGPAPITVITREDIDREGFQTVGDMLQTLSQNTSSSFTGDLGVTGFTPNAQVVNLRNLGPGYTLTLVNGRRPAQYPQPYNRDNNVVNIRAIPSSIIERVEVLTGGASAIYGSDAIAGVVNIVLREDFDGNLLRGTVGTTAEGGGDSVNFEYTGGRTGDRWSTTFALQYAENEPVFASQRDFLADTRDNPWGLTVNPSLSLVALSAAGLAGPPGHNLLDLTPEQCAAFGYEPGSSASRGDWCGSYTQSGSRSIWNKSRFYSGYGYGTFDLDGGTQLFGSVTLYQSDAKSSGGTEFWGTSTDQFLPQGVFYDPNFGDLLQLQRVFNPFELGGNEAASTLYDEKSWDLMVGARGTLGERFDWEGYVHHAEYDYESNRPRLLAKGVHDYFLGPQLGTLSGYPIYELNLDRYTSPITPDVYDSFSTRVINRGETSSSTVSFNVTGDLFDMPAGPVGFAAVVEGVRQETTLRSDPRTDPLRPLDEETVYNLVSSGDTDGSRDRYALGMEFRVPLLESLTAMVAGRYDKYDDITAVDDAVTYNLGLEWRPIDSLMVRGSYATSFKAPDMQLVYAAGAASYSTILDVYSCRTGEGLGQDVDPVTGQPIPRTSADCELEPSDPTVYQTQTTVAGNPGLKEEEGKTWTAGFVWDITDRMSLTADYWHITLDDAAAQLDSGYILDTEAACRLGGYENPDRPAPSAAVCDNVLSLVTRTDAPGTTLDGRIERINSAYINTASQEIEGVDANFRYTYDTDRWGTFRFETSYSMTISNKYQQLAEDDLVDYRDAPPYYFYPERSRVRGSVGWNRDDWNVTLFGTRYGSAWGYQERNGCFTGANSDVCFSRRVHPYMLYNLQVGKKFGDSVEAQLSVVNLLDNQYRDDPGNSAYPYFDPWIGADPLGRRFYLSVSYKF